MFFARRHGIVALNVDKGRAERERGLHSGRSRTVRATNIAGDSTSGGGSNKLTIRVEIPMDP